MSENNIQQSPGVHSGVASGGGDPPPPPFSVDRLDKESMSLPAGKAGGWRAFEDLDVRFNPGELSLVGGRTGHGKTTTLVGLTANWLPIASEQEGGGLILFYSCEEPEVRIYHRILAVISAQDGEGWTSNQIRDFLRDKNSRLAWPSPDSLVKARAMLKAWQNRLMIIYKPHWSVTDIENHAKAMAQKVKIGAILVDYLQRIPPPPGAPYEHREAEVAAVARRLKSLAVDLYTPVIAGAQVSRESIPDGYWALMRTAKTYDRAKDVIRQARPQLWHLSEGGAEQEADIVLGLLNYRSDYQEEALLGAPQVTLLEVGTLKNRYGIPGQWTGLALDGRFGLIRDPAILKRI